MDTLPLITLGLLLLAVVGWAIWNWRREAQLQQLAERAQQQGELIEAMNAVLDNPQLSEEEQLEQSQRLVEKLKATQR